MLKKKKIIKSKDTLNLKGNLLFDFLSKDAKIFRFFIDGISYMIRNKEIFDKTGMWETNFYETHVKNYQEYDEKEGIWICLNDDLNIKTVDKFFIKNERNKNAIHDSFDWMFMLDHFKDKDYVIKWEDMSELSNNWKKHVRKEENK